MPERNDLPTPVLTPESLPTISWWSKLIDTKMRSPLIKGIAEGMARLGLVSSMLTGGSPPVVDALNAYLASRKSGLEIPIKTEIAYVDGHLDNQQKIEQTISLGIPVPQEIVLTALGSDEAPLEGPILPEYISKNGVVRIVNFSDPTDKFLLSPRLIDSLDQLEAVAKRQDIADLEGKFNAVDGISIILDPELQLGMPRLWGMARRPPEGVPFNPRIHTERIMLIQHTYIYTPEGGRYIELRLNKGQLSSPITEAEGQGIEETVREELADSIFLVKSGSPEYNSGFPGINDLPARTLKRALFDMQPVKVTLTPSPALAQARVEEVVEQAVVAVPAGDEAASQRLFLPEYSITYPTGEEFVIINDPLSDNGFAIDPKRKIMVHNKETGRVSLPVLEQIQKYQNEGITVGQLVLEQMQKYQVKSLKIIHDPLVDTLPRISYFPVGAIAPFSSIPYFIFNGTYDPEFKAVELHYKWANPPQQLVADQFTTDPIDAFIWKTQVHIAEALFFAGQGLPEDLDIVAFHPLRNSPEMVRLQGLFKATRPIDVIIPSETSVQAPVEAAVKQAVTTIPELTNLTYDTEESLLQYMNIRNPSKDESARFFEALNRFAKEENLVSITGCQASPVALKLKPDSQFQIKNNDSFGRTLMFRQRISVPASQTQTVKTDFGIGAHGYRCDGQGFEHQPESGIFFVVD